MKRNKNLVCDPGICDHCTYLGEGDFICDKNTAPDECHVVMEDWQPTDKYLWCQNQKRQKSA